MFNEELNRLGVALVCQEFILIECGVSDPITRV